MHLYKDLSPTEQSAAISRVNLLEAWLFDTDGHVRHGITPSQAIGLLDQMNALRRTLGWLNLDMERHQVWPDNSSH